VKVYNVNALSHEQLVSSKTGEVFSKSAVLTELFSCQKLFVHHEILSPGKKASAPHRHTTQEELIFVLDGFPTAHLGDQAVRLTPGDFVGFNPGSEDLYFIENTTNEDVRFLVICSKQKDDHVIFQQAETNIFEIAQKKL